MSPLRAHRVIAIERYAVPAPFRGFAVRSDEACHAFDARPPYGRVHVVAAEVFDAPARARLAGVGYAKVDIGEPFAVDYAATTLNELAAISGVPGFTGAIARALQATRVLGDDFDAYERSVATRIDWLASRGAGFHNDVARHWSRSLFWLLALDVGEVEFVLAHAGLRVPLAAGDLLVFDQTLAHALCRPADGGVALAASFDNGDAGRQLFLTGEMVLSDAQWAALGAPWQPVERFAQRAALDLMVAGFDDRGGAIQRVRSLADCMARTTSHVDDSIVAGLHSDVQNPLMGTSDLDRMQPRRHSAAAIAAVALTACASPPSTTPQAPPVTPAAAQAAGMTPDELALQQGFARWVAGFEQSARAAGVDDATLHSAFDAVRYLPRAVAADRTQPEFTRAVWDYVDAIVSPGRIERGQEKLTEVQAELAAAEARYGVPQATIVAIWGIESDYGRNVGDTPTIDALATLGFEGRREAWAREQLMAALEILKNGDIARADMIGSWAGAMGQTQFIPTAFLAYAVDADGDGRRDIWGSMADVIASTANFLARSGWQAGQDWGAEVKLPDGFDAGRADDGVRQASAQWAGEGVQTLDGVPLPDIPDGAIFLPAGVRGPAFLVGANFRTLLRYNNSTSYALAVSLLAQRIAGGPGVQADWPRDQLPLSREQVRALQKALADRGFEPGAADGQFGPTSRQALRAWQRTQGLPADGFATLDLLARLQAP